MQKHIPASVFQFLKELQANNNRDWFLENKERYQEQHGYVVQFADELLAQMNKVDNIETPSGKKSNIQRRSILKRQIAIQNQYRRSIHTCYERTAWRILLPH
jgi:uncharacterized protein (DUF2461 family)